ncbi:HTH-type transcriptional activator TipA [Acrocarpospora phusangensis]|uniref:HTH-type transcriptional activator TipA n=1 Tax=Acrocarpospora phusangensis TaxID=1070424 RepID=A0A919QG16_9ACTN|nr:MerR family transcriptional regulator [Acrocarpospora phusangensis]GIH26730.1 HTH-type transcriptional activator TipA [Acrocarpospora phusangensis]
MSYTVGQVAAFASVTVRTLHHYDEIGLLTPGERSHAGYRRYTEADLDRLQQILFYRELGFSLEEITAILDDPAVDPVTHLRRQHELLRGRIDRLRDMLAAVETAMEAKKMGISLTPGERFEVFGDFRPEEHEPEAERRWGDSDAYRESRRRTAAYGKADWLELKREGGAVVEGFAACLAEGVPATDARATALAERHREHISRWFYACGYDIHRGLADMYVADPRFAATYEAVAEGLAAYIRDAVHANADERGA